MAVLLIAVKPISSKRIKSTRKGSITETFNPVFKPYRSFYFIDAVSHGWLLRQLDPSITFLHAHLHQIVVVV